MSDNADLGSGLTSSIQIPKTDWAKLRLIDQSLPLIPGGSLNPNPDAWLLLKWLGRAEDATRARRASTPFLGIQTSANIADLEGGSFVTQYEKGDIWALETSQR